MSRGLLGDPGPKVASSGRIPDFVYRFGVCLNHSGMSLCVEKMVFSTFEIQHPFFFEDLFFDVVNQFE